MKLITVPIELAKEELKSGVVESAKKSIEFGEFGRQTTENISFGKALTEDCGKRISFGSLASGEFKQNENYIRWKDGIATNELKPKWIKELANEIAAIYGSDMISVKRKHGFDNAGMVPDEGVLLYDPKYLRDAGNEHGMDDILGILSHEVGHRVVYNLGLQEYISEYEGEACADYIAGLTARLCKLNPSHRLSWCNSQPLFSPDNIHPGRAVRREAFVRGLSRIDIGKEADFLKNFEDFSPYDLDKVYQNKDLLRDILYQDVIEPLRKGEIKRV